MIDSQLTASVKPRARSSVSIRTIALPAEHGGWDFLLEPIALGLLLAPSVAGWYLALSAIAFFLARQPLTLLIANRKRFSMRQQLARRFAVLYLAIASLSLVAAIGFSRHPFVLPLLIATPFAGVQLLYELSGGRRQLTAEIAGAVAVSSLASATAIAGGWNLRPAIILSGLMIARAVPSIFYVRECIYRMRHRGTSIYPTAIVHVTALVTVALLAAKQMAPVLAVVAIGLLTIRAVAGITLARKMTPKKFGLSEIAFGLMTVLAIAIGFRSRF